MTQIQLGDESFCRHVMDIPKMSIRQIRMLPRRTQRTSGPSGCDSFRKHSKAVHGDEDTIRHAKIFLRYLARGLRIPHGFKDGSGIDTAFEVIFEFTASPMGCGDKPLRSIFFPEAIDEANDTIPILLRESDFCRGVSYKKRVERAFRQSGSV